MKTEIIDIEREYDGTMILKFHGQTEYYDWCYFPIHLAKNSDLEIFHKLFVGKEYNWESKTIIFV